MNTLYFAYGSNLSLAQMAARCPGSKLLGTAVLPGFHWQINQRHYANVIQAPGAGTAAAPLASSEGQEESVAGLLFELAGPGDEAALDRAEGVSSRCYDKEYHTVLFCEAHPLLAGRDVAWIARQGGPAAVLASAGPVPIQHSFPATSRKDGVLVYLSRLYIQDGSPYGEYIGRLCRGIADSVALGVDPAFLRQRFLPYAPELEPAIDSAVAALAKTFDNGSIRLDPSE